MTTTRARVSVSLAALSMLALAACGSSKTTPTSTAAPATTAAPAATTAAPVAAAPAAGAADPMKSFVADKDAKPVACTAPAGQPLKVAWVYLGPINDGGWTQAHDQGRLLIEKTLGNKVKTSYKENVPEGPQVVQVLEDLIKDGNKLIFGTSFGYQDGFLEVAAKHPDVCFDFATGYKTAPNMAQFYGAGEDTMYLSGMAAGAASKNGKLGYLAPFPISEVIRNLNAFTLGAQATRPGATVQVVWTYTWFDPAKERAAAESLIAAGVDVIGSEQDSPAAGEAAKVKGLPWVGHNTDQNANFPDIWVTATVFNWGPYELARAKQALEGKWVAGNYYGNLADGFVTLATMGKIVPADAQAKVKAKMAELTAKPGSEFTGPIKDQSGKIRAEAGKQIPLFTDVKDADSLLGMNFLVQGVVGEIPKT
jgi:basic membrane protein A and related proteins